MAYRPYNHDPEEAIAYAWMVITIFVIVAGFLILVYYAVINSILNGPGNDQSVGVNHDIKAGKQSQQSRNAINFNVEFAKNLPVLTILGILVFAVARSIVVKKVP